MADDNSQQNQQIPTDPEEDLDRLFEEAVNSLEGAADDHAEDTSPEQQASEDPVQEAGEVPYDEEESSPDHAPDPWQQRYLELQTEYNRLQEAERANRGRVSALQKQMSQMEKAQQQQTPSEALESPSMDPDMESFAQDYPEVWEAMRARERVIQAMFNERLEALQQEVKQPISELSAQAEASKKMAELRKLEKAHPDFETIQRDEGFWNWVRSQSAGVQQLAESALADDNIALLNMFKAQFRPQAKASSDSSRKQVADDALPRTTPTRSFHSPAGDPKDADRAWEEASRLMDEDLQRDLRHRPG